MKIIHKTQTQMESHLYLLYIKAAESESTTRNLLIIKSSKENNTPMFITSAKKADNIHAMVI